MTTLGPDAMHPAQFALAVTPNNDADLPLRARSLYIGGAGNIALVTVGGSSITFNNIPAGFILPVRVARVLATGTTATQIVSLA
jgi:hypothetical protein